MADEFEQYRRKPAAPAADDFEQYKRSPAAAAQAAEAPGYFMPGSKTETALRRLSQAATFGFGDEAQAAIRSIPAFLTPGRSGVAEYQKLRDQERTANTAAAAANPMTDLAASVTGAVVPGLAVANAGRAAYAIPSIASRATPGVASAANALAPATRAAIAAGAAGTAQGALKGAGESTSVKNMPRDVAQQATFEGSLGSVVPGVDSLMGRFVQNYRGLRPAVTANIGPVTVGGIGGGVAGATGYLPSINGLVGDPTMTRQETWSSDPYSKIADTVGYGIAGAIAGKGVKELARTGGAIQKTMAGQGQSGGVYSVPRGPARPTGTAGGGSGGDLPPPKGPAAPPDLPNDQARRQAMQQASTPQGRAETNSQSPVRDAIKQVGETADAVRNTTRSVNDIMGDFGEFSRQGRGATARPAPTAEPLVWPELDLQDVAVERLRGAASETAVPPAANPWARIVKELEGASTPVTQKQPPGNTMSMTGRQVREPEPSYNTGTTPVDEGDVFERLRVNPDTLRKENAKRIGELADNDETHDTYVRVLREIEKESGNSRIANTDPWIIKKILDNNPVGKKTPPNDAISMTGRQVREPEPSYNTGNSPEDALFDKLRRKDFEVVREELSSAIKRLYAERGDRLLNGQSISGIDDILNKGTYRDEILRNSGWTEEDYSAAVRQNMPPRRSLD